MSLKEEVQEILETGYANAYEIEAITEYIEELEKRNAELETRTAYLLEENHGLQEDLQLSDEALKECIQRCNNE